MEMFKDTIDGQVVITLAGRIDSTVSEEFEDKLTKIIDSGVHNPILSFLNVQYISSAGLRVLLIAAKKATQEGGKLYITDLSKAVKEVFNVFDMSGFSAILEIHETVQAATNKINKKK